MARAAYVHRVMRKIESAPLLFDDGRGYQLRLERELRLLKMLRERNRSVPRRAHVLCSGPTVVDGLGLVGPNDFVVGFNCSPMLPVRCDLIMIEDASDFNQRCHRYSILIRDIVTYQRGLGDSIVALKNFWARDLITSSFVMQHYGMSVFMLRDTHLPLPRFQWSTATLRMLGRLLCSPPYGECVQWGSTALTAIAMCYRLGASEIVVHGLDLAGPHFWHLNDRQLPAVDSQLLARVRAITGEKRESVPHFTADYVLCVLPHVRDYLEANGTHIRCSTSASPAARILGAVDGPL